MKRYTNQDEVDGLLKFIDSSPTPYHAADTLAGMLDEAGAVKLSETTPWGEILPGMLYYYVRSDSAIVAFRLGETAPAESGWRITLTHLDYPCLHVRPHASGFSNSYERLNVETYGGLIHHSWFDRPLALAGRVYTASTYSDDVVGVNINIDRPLLVIPELAIHMNRGVNDGAKFNPQTELLPFFAQDFDNAASFMSFIASEAGVDEEDILSYDLIPYDAAPSTVTGGSSEFISAPHLDNGEMAYCAFRGFIESSDSGAANSLVIAFDHEEIGSQSDRGARSELLQSTLCRIHEKLGYSGEDTRIAMARSLICSADMAHASHPSHPETFDSEHKIFMNRGPVLKHSYSQTYIESPRVSAIVRRLFAEHHIPYQEFVNRNDLRGGSTVGPMSSSACGIPGFDIGAAILSMHSIREFGGALDVFYSTEFFEAFNI